MGRLREDRSVGRPSAPPRAPTPAVEHRQLDVPLARQPRESLLRAEDLPLRRDHAPVLARIGVADHHLEPTAWAAVEQLADQRFRAAQVVDRLQQRDDLELEAGLGRQ